MFIIDRNGFKMEVVFGKYKMTDNITLNLNILIFQL